MDTVIKNPAPSAAANPNGGTAKAPPVDTTAATPEKVDTAQAVQASGRAGKPAMQQASLSSALTTYKDQDSGRLIVRVYDRQNGDILVEFPPERAFRAIEEVLTRAGFKPQKSFSV